MSDPQTTGPVANALIDGESVLKGDMPEKYHWKGPGPAPASWFVDGVKVYRSYEDYCDG